MVLYRDMAKCTDLRPHGQWGFSAALSDLPKIVAMVTMVMDHIGWIFFPENDLWRIVGRVSFPVFAWYAAAGYTRTSNLQKYLLRILAVGLISQIPYAIALAQAGGVFGLNILFTILLGLLTVYAWEKRRAVLLAVILLLSFTPVIDYQWYGVLLILFFYIFRLSLIKQLTAFICLTFFFGFFWGLQVYAVFALLLFFVPGRNRQFRLPRYFFYVFYPGHLLLLTVIFWYLRV